MPRNTPVPRIPRLLRGFLTFSAFTAFVLSDFADATTLVTFSSAFSAFFADGAELALIRTTLLSLVFADDDFLVFFALLATVLSTFFANNLC